MRFFLGTLVTLMSLEAVGEVTIRVVSYNIHHGRGIDGEVNLERIAAIIRQFEPDVVCLQEVDRNLPRTDRRDFPAEFARLLNMKAVFEANFRFDGGEYGNATLSRLPIVDFENLNLPGADGTEPRGCLRVTLQVGSRRVHVLNTHFALTPPERLEQAGAVIDWMSPGESVILAGDLNETPDAAGVRMFAGPLRDSFEILGLADRYTSPSRAPRRQIDYILASPDLMPVHAEVLYNDATRIASDHLPLAAHFRLSPETDAAAEAGILDTDDVRIPQALEPNN